MHSARTAEWLQLIKEASLRVIFKTSCWVFRPCFCASISEWSSLLLPTPHVPGLSPQLLVSLTMLQKHTGKSSTTDCRLWLLKSAPPTAFSHCFGFYSKQPPFYGVLALHSGHAGQRNLGGGAWTLIQCTCSFSSDFCGAAWLRCGATAVPPGCTERQCGIRQRALIQKRGCLVLPWVFSNFSSGVLVVGVVGVILVVEVYSFVNLKLGSLLCRIIVIRDMLVNV